MAYVYHRPRGMKEAMSSRPDEEGRGARAYRATRLPKQAVLQALPAHEVGAGRQSGHVHRLFQADRALSRRFLPIVLLVKINTERGGKTLPGNNSETKINARPVYAHDD